MPTQVFNQLSISTASGTPPLAVNQTALVTNLNADLLDGQHGSYYQNANNLNAGTIPAAQMPAHTGDVTSTAGSVSLSLPNVGTAGTYRSVTTDAKGRVTAGTNPTSLAGYGITDALPLGGGTLTGLLNASQGLLAPGADINYAAADGWTAGTGDGVGYYGTNFGANGAAAENTRSYKDTPYSSPGLVWATTNNDAASNDDGGWNKDISGLIANKTYRSIVWVRRTSVSTNGSYYHGCSSGSTLNLDNTANTNPYFSNFSIATFVQSKWYLSVGYIHANNDASTTSYGALYDGETGQKILNYTDFKMAAGATTQTHRVYLYYSTDPAALLDFWGPRFEEVDGNEPSVGALLGFLPSPRFTGTPTVNGSTIIHAGNYTSYPDATKLPLSGGTLSGLLTASSGITITGSRLYVSSAASGQTYGGTVHIRDNEATGANNSFAGIAFSSSPGADFVIGKYSNAGVGRLQIRNHQATVLATIEADGSASFAGGLTATNFTGPGTGLTGTAAGLSIGGSAVQLNGQAASFYQNAGNLNAGTLLAARMPAFTGGDVTSTAGTVALTLANSGVTAGTYRSVTTDAKGRVTAGTNPTTLAGYGITDALPLTGGTLTGTLSITNTGPIIILRDSDSAAGASQIGYISLQDSAGTERGWIGFGSTVNTDLTMYNGRGDVVLSSSTGVARVGSNAIIHAATTSAPNLSVGGSSARWANGRTISLTGDVSGTSAAFDGTAALSFATTLANSGVGAGTYRSVTVNAKGLVTAGTNPTTLSGYGITDAMYQVDPNGFTQGDIYGSGNMQRLWGTDSVQNLIAFRPPTTVEYTTDNVNWVTTTISNDVFDGKVFGKWAGFNMNVGSNIGAWTKVRMTWVNFGYHFFSHFTLCHSTNGHSMNFVFYKSDLNGVFSSEAYRVNGISSWPGYTFTSHVNVSGHWDTRDVRMVFELNGNNGPSGYPNNAISIGHIGIMGGYSSFIRVYDWDGNRNITLFGNLTLPGNVTAPRFISNVATGTAPFGVTSTTAVTNLNADLLDGQEGSYYQNAGNLNAGTILAARLPAFTGGDVTSTAGAVTLTLATVATAGTYRSVTVDAKGRVTAGTNPTTLAGYGITDIVSSNVGSPVAADTTTKNGFYYVNSNISLFGQTDGALFVQAYDNTWASQIYQDYRTGQLAIRGRNSGTWQAWRTVLDSTNFLTAAPNSGVTAGTYNNVTVNNKGIVTGGSNVSYLTGNQSITLSGDLTGSGTTSIVATIAGDSITNAKLKTMAATTIKGNNTGVANAPADLTPAQVATMLSGQTMNIAGSSTSCPWSGITGKPTTLAGYGITDALSSTINQQGGKAYTVHDFNTYPSLYDVTFVNPTGSTNLPTGMTAVMSYRFIMGAGDTATRGFDLVGAAEGSGNLYIRERSLGTWSRVLHSNNFPASAPNSGVTAGTYNNVTVTAKGLVTGGSNVSYLTGNQTITFSGDVTGSGTTAITATIPNSTITNAKLNTMGAATIKGNNGGVANSPSDLSVAQVATMLSGQTMNINGSSASCTGNAATATNGFTVKPGWAGNQNLIEEINNFNLSKPSGFYQGYQATNSPSATWYNLINVRHSNTANDHGFQLAMSYYDETLWSRSYQGGTGANNGTFTAWRAHLHSGNYTNYPPARWATGRTISLTGDVTGTSGAFDGTANLSFAATIANSSVTYAKIQNVTAFRVLGNSSPSAAQAPVEITMASLAGMLSGQTMNIAGSSTSCTGNAATATLATKASTLSQNGGTGSAMTFNWSGQSGQPTWLWGSNDGVNIYVWNPSNFSVASAASCSGSAAQLNGQAASYYENRDTTSVSISAGTLTLGRGAGNLTTTLGGRVVAWCDFNGNFASSQSPNASFNVSSITKNATGDYTVNFSSSLGTANYVVAGTAQLDTPSPGSSNYNVMVAVPRRSGAKAAGSCRVVCEYPSGVALYDSISVGVAFIAA